MREVKARTCGCALAVQISLFYCDIYRNRSRRFSAVRVWTHSRNRCTPAKFASPSLATNAAFLFSRASCQRFDSRAALSVVSRASICLSPDCLINRSFSPGGLKKYFPIELRVAISSCETSPPTIKASLNKSRPPGLSTRRRSLSISLRRGIWQSTSLE